ncbi:MAG: polysaccharide export protein [Pseudomonadota bacterium]
MSPRQRLWLLPLLALINGCVLVPGSNIDSSGLDSDDDSLQRLVNIVPITETSVQEQVRSGAFAVEQSVPEAMPMDLVQQIRNYEYRISPGDVLTITVYEHPELTIPAGSQRTAEESGNIVHSDGSIFYPYIGSVDVEGRTVNEVRDIIADRLAQYINDPQVDVKVIAYRSKRAYVTGQVDNPGPQPVTNVPLTVMDAISNAGGPSENANWHEVLLTRDGEETRISLHEMLNNGRLGQNLLLQHGDVLHVPEIGEQQVFVLGELNDVNMLPMGNLRMSLTEALTRAGGLNQVTSNASGIFVIRQTQEGADRLATVYQLSVRNAIAFAVGTRFMLEPMDIVYVTTAPVTRWNRVISQIMPSVTALLAMDSLGN